jgi:hypothetical protein
VDGASLAVNPGLCREVGEPERAKSLVRGLTFVLNEGVEPSVGYEEVDDERRVADWRGR